EVDQRSLRCCFARTRRTRHEHKSAPQVSKFLHDYRNPELLKGRNLGGNQSKCRGIPFRLLKVVAAKSRVLIHLVGKIEIAVLPKDLPVMRAANLAQHALGFIVRNRLGTNGHDVAMRSYFWGLAFCDMQIRPALPDDDLQELIKISHGLITNDE